MTLSASGVVSALLGVDEAAARLRCSRRRVFELLSDDTLVRGPKYGRRTMVTAASVAAALEPTPTPVLNETSAPKPRARRSLRAELDELREQQRAQWKKSA